MGKIYALYTISLISGKMERMTFCANIDKTKEQISIIRKMYGFTDVVEDLEGKLEQVYDIDITDKPWYGLPAMYYKPMGSEYLLCGLAIKEVNVVESKIRHHEQG